MTGAPTLNDGAAADPDLNVRVLVVGAGPTGLGAATRLHQHGVESWLIVDSTETPGGLACTDVTPEGFAFDMGGHVIFSHYQYFDDLLDAALGPDAWNHHERASYVRLKGRWVAYPFQNNIATLDPDDRARCLRGLVEARVQSATASGHPANFDEWILRTLGEGIADIFMRPYNFKVWAYPTSEMQCAWLGERVATADTGRAIDNVVHGREDQGWGPNATFRFPKEGGTGAIWKGVARLLPPARCRFGPGCGVASVDVDGRMATLEDGTRVRYQAMVSTVPLDVACGWVGRPELGLRLKHSSTHVVGVGYRGACPHPTKCWLYFPESDCPFYRCTVFSNYAAANCPDQGKALPTLCLADGTPAPPHASLCQGPYWSLMFEIAESPARPVDQSPVDVGGRSLPAVVRDTMQGAVATGLAGAGDEVVSIYYRRIEMGYPTPCLQRDAVLAEALPLLKSRGIWQRGRFGSWKYEVANQDHSLMLGVEAVDNALFGGYEMTLEAPDFVNRRRNTDMRFKVAPA